MRAYWTLSLILALACDPGGGMVTRDGSVPDGDADIAINDADGDGISDEDEGFGDSDNDFIPDYLDPIGLGPTENRRDPADPAAGLRFYPISGLEKSWVGQEG